MRQVDNTEVLLLTYTCRFVPAKHREKTSTAMYKQLAKAVSHINQPVSTPARHKHHTLPLHFYQPTVQETVLRRATRLNLCCRVAEPENHNIAGNRRGSSINTEERKMKGLGYGIDMQPTNLPGHCLCIMPQTSPQGCGLSAIKFLDSHQNRPLAESPRPYHKANHSHSILRDLKEPR